MGMAPYSARRVSIVALTAVGLLGCAEANPESPPEPAPVPAARPTPAPEPSTPAVAPAPAPGPAPDDPGGLIAQLLRTRSTAQSGPLQDQLVQRGPSAIDALDARLTRSDRATDNLLLEVLARLGPRGRAIVLREAQEAPESHIPAFRILATLDPMPPGAFAAATRYRGSGNYPQDIRLAVAARSESESERATAVEWMLSIARMETSPGQGPIFDAVDADTPRADELAEAARAVAVHEVEGANFVSSRTAAIRALGRVAGPEDVALLGRLAAHAERSVYLNAFTALAEAGEAAQAAAGPLRAASRRPPEERQVYGLSALAQVSRADHRAAIAGLLRLSRTASPTMRSRASDQLSRAATEQDFPTIERQLSRGDAWMDHGFLMTLVSEWRVSHGRPPLGVVEGRDDLAATRLEIRAVHADDPGTEETARALVSTHEEELRFCHSSTAQRTPSRSPTLVLVASDDGWSSPLPAEHDYFHECVARMVARWTRRSTDRGRAEVELTLSTPPPPHDPNLDAVQERAFGFDRPRRRRRH